MCLRQQRCISATCGRAKCDFDEDPRTHRSRPVIRFHLAKLIADKSFEERRRVELGEIAEGHGHSP